MTFSNVSGEIPAKLTIADLKLLREAAEFISHQEFINPTQESNWLSENMWSLINHLESD